ncbi:phosphate signaling complex protein PhoU [Caloramator proteoclasticus]|uniref:Phosphate-specific transport system accessory protein PhoU n=1 Tax=Caloramator proteoclasticus DSM 10124 TaxID=1121262 RepID=A0A1M4W5R6_9CLOT|nr:phosphate signaling complex protein PhoU [Caloramator proteoclasticus]SHE76601.1 phosphate uptake regulator, PhoU [Caloramator proteoclasticus DSM 10124]
MREHLDQQLTRLNHDLIKMGAMVETIIDKAVTSLKNQDLELAKEIYTEDDAIDEMELKIEKDCLNLIALQQPMAKDLRRIASALKIITDLERIGDHAVNIAKITLEIGNESLMKPLIDIPKMAEIAQNMIKLSLDAFVNQDIEIAKRAAEMDEEVDKLYDTVINEVFQYIQKDSKFLNQGIKLLFVGRYLERVADHTTNICERIIYMVTGERVEIN